MFFSAFLVEVSVKFRNELHLPSAQLATDSFNQLHQLLEFTFLKTIPY